MKSKQKVHTATSNIFVLLSSTGLTVTDVKILNQPQENKEKYFQIVCHLVKICLNVPELCNTDYIAPDMIHMIDHNDHGQATRFQNQYAIVNNFLDRIGLNGFDLIQDYVYVTKERADRIINELVKFYNFKMIQSQISCKAEENYQIQLLKNEQMINRTKLLKEKQQNIRIQKAKERPRFLQCQRLIIQKLKNRESKMNKRQSMMPEYQRVVLEYEQIHSNSEKLFWESKLVNQKNIQLKNKLIKQDMESLEKQKQNLQNEMKQIRTAISQEDTNKVLKFQILSTKLIQYEKINSQINSINDEYLKILQKRFEKENEWNQLQKIKKQKYDEQSEYNKQKTRQQKTISDLQHNEQLMTKSSNQKQQQIQTLTSVLSDFWNKDSEIQKIIKSMNKEQQRILTSTESMCQQFMTFENVLKNRMEDLQSKFRAYYDSRKRAVASQHQRVDRIFELNDSIKSPFQK